MEQLKNLFSDFSIGLFCMQTFLLLLLIFVLRKFAWKQIIKSVNDREDSIKEALASAELAKQEMRDVNAKSEQLLKEAALERQAIVKEAHEAKDRIIATAKKSAMEQADALIERATTEIETQKKAALSEVKDLVKDLSLAIAEKILKAELSDERKQKDLVTSLLEKADLKSK